jgi:hypothetical protein
MMSANVFGMDPDGTRTGLGAAGVAAQAGATPGLSSSLPNGEYTAVYTAAARTLLTKLAAEAEGLVASGVMTSEASVTAMELAEGQNVGQLRT